MSDRRTIGFVPRRFGSSGGAAPAVVALVVAVVVAVLVGVLDGARISPVAAGDSGPSLPFASLSASDAAAADAFGAAVDISGDTLIVGANGQDDLGFSAGAAYVFQRDPGDPDFWQETAVLTASDGQALDWFGVDVAISGDTVVVGAQLSDAVADASGAAYIFEREGGVWREVTRLVASDGEHNDDFGIGVEIDRDTVVIGALLKNTEAGRDAGAAYVYQRDRGGPDAWGEVVRLVAGDGAFNDRFGRSVDVSGDTIAVGASLADAPAANAGAVYLFERNAGGPDAWGEVAKLVASDAQTGDNLGFGVAIDGQTLVAGAHLGGAGSAYVFQRDPLGGDAWNELAELQGPTDPLAQFGRVVDLRGGAIVVGAPHEANVAGAAYLFEQQANGEWSPAGRLALAAFEFPDQLGWGVAIDGGTAVVGAPHADLAGSDVGAAIVASGVPTGGADPDGPSGPDGQAPKGLLELEPGGQFVQWAFPDKQAAELFAALTIAWLFDEGSVSWTSFIPQLGITDFLVTNGAVLWLVSPDGADIVVSFGPPGSFEPPSDTVRVRAPIESVNLLIAESFPPQYFVEVVSALPNGCAEFDGFDVERDGTTVLINVWNLVPHPSLDIACIEIFRTEQSNVALGSDFEPGVEYTLLVNDFEMMTFIAQ